jgi:hypothetical protein
MLQACSCFSFLETPPLVLLLCFGTVTIFLHCTISWLVQIRRLGLGRNSGLQPRGCRTKSKAMARNGAGGLDQSRKARPLYGWWRSGKPRQSHVDFLMFEKEIRSDLHCFSVSGVEDISEVFS